MKKKAYLLCQSSYPERSLSATWGKMAAEILTGNWDGALEEIQKLREAIDQKVKRRAYIAGTMD